VKLVLTNKLGPYARYVSEADGVVLYVNRNSFPVPPPKEIEVEIKHDNDP